MPKVIVNLTDTQIRSAVNSHKKLLIKVQIKLADGKGLFFIIDKNGSAYWRWDYARPITKKRNSISFGIYPEVSLLNARAKRTECRELLAQIIDPAVVKKNEEEAKSGKNTFALIADEYRKTEELEPSTQRRNQFVWGKLYAAIGDYPIDSITPSQI